MIRIVLIAAFVTLAACGVDGEPVSPAAAQDQPAE